MMSSEDIGVWLACALTMSVHISTKDLVILVSPYSWRVS
jgi:hypothetical protein